MRVLYDHQIFQEQDFGGISRYFAELYSSDAGFSAEIAVKRSRNQHLLSQPEIRDRLQTQHSNLYNYLRELNFRGKHRLYPVLRKIVPRHRPETTNRNHSIASISSSQYDLFHPTYYDPYFLEALAERPFVLTVFDMIHEVFPEHNPLGDHTSLRKKTLCKEAARIIAISDTTKNDLILHLGIDPQKIDVVYLAAAIDWENSPQAGAGRLPEKFILFTGNRRGYKNFYFFVRVIADILTEHRSLKLVCTGPPFSEEENSFFEHLSIADRVVHRAASEDELGALYAGAEMFVFPSLYEGFGIPILEGFACGCPVVLSDTLAMREVAGEAALFFHPKSVSELRSAVLSVLSDDALKRTLVERGHQRARLFSWQKTALETAEVYRRALGRAARS